MSKTTQSVPSAGNLCKVSIHTIRDHQNFRVEESVDTFLEDDYKLDDLQRGFRWIHIPMNNMRWVEVRTLQMTQVD